MGWIKCIFRILAWIIGVVLLFMLLDSAADSDRRNCEERIASELKTTAVYINNHCMVKGYGRADGR